MARSRRSFRLLSESFLPHPLSFIALVVVLFGSAEAGATTQVGLFCGTVPLRPCDDLIADLLPKTEQNIESVINAFKAGKVLNPIAGPGEDPYLAGFQVATPTCNVGQTGAACGTPCKFACSQTGGSTTPIPVGGAAPVPTPTPSSAPPIVTCTLQTSAGTCSLERAWTRGALISLVRSKLQALKSDIQSASHSYTLGARCEALATQLTQTVTQLLGQASGVSTSQFDSAKTAWDAFFAQGGQLPVCAMLAPGPVASAVPAPDSEKAAPAAAQCQMIAAVPMLSSFAFQAVGCEVFARAETEWLASESDRYPENMKINLQNAVGACTGATPPFPGTLSDCVNSQYAATIAAAFSGVTAAPAPMLIAPPGRMNACQLSGSTIAPWEPILCSANPPSPFIVAELGAMIEGSESLSKVADVLTAAGSFKSEKAVPMIRIDQ